MSKKGMSTMRISPLTRNIMAIIVARTQEKLVKHNVSVDEGFIEFMKENHPDIYDKAKEALDREEDEGR